MIEQISKRQKSNFEIAKMLEDLTIGHMRVDTSDGRTISLPEAFKELSEAYPQQRAGQIFCNYLCPDYRDKDGKIDRYYNLDEILRLDIDPKTKQEFKDKFGKMVYFDSNDSCKVGKLCGLEENYQLSMLYYIISSANNEKIFVPTYQSLSLV